MTFICVFHYIPSFFSCNSNVFNEIEFHSIELWKYNMFFMVVEFNKKPIVPVPLSAVQALIELILYCTKMSKVSKKNVKSK